jgi:tyrosine-specific transport protein
VALEFAGGIGCALLLGLLPILMVWSKRYRMGQYNHAFIGGKPILLLLIAFVLIELLCEAILRFL